jgi:hypothetical protein
VELERGRSRRPAASYELWAWGMGMAGHWRVPRSARGAGGSAMSARVCECVSETHPHITRVHAALHLHLPALPPFFLLQLLCHCR